MAKHEFCKKKGIFSDQSDVIKQLFHACAKAKIYFQRVPCKQRNWQCIFPQNVTFFSQCNYVRIGQTIQNEISLERSIFADVVAYQFINWNWEQNGCGKEDVRRSENDQSNRRRVKMGIWRQVARKSLRDLKGSLCAYKNILFTRTTQILRPWNLSSWPNLFSQSLFRIKMNISSLPCKKFRGSFKHG